MCGIVGLSHSPQASLKAFQALLMLQHRGQDSAGLLSFSDNRFHLHKGLGLVAQVFDSYRLSQLTGEFAIGHTRYSTIGKIKEADIQPMLEAYPYGIGAVHNGNISNFQAVKETLKVANRYLHSDNDLEAIIHLMAKGFCEYENSDFFKTIAQTVDAIFKTCEGGYSVISFIAGKGMVAFCDPYGIRPLILGTKDEGTTGGGRPSNKSYMLASESNSLSFLGYELMGDVEPGEVLWIDPAGALHRKRLSTKTAKPCMFEWIYFSGAENTWQGRNVYETRLELGKKLAVKVRAALQDQALKDQALKDQPLKENTIDLVAPVPDTSRSSAIALSEALNLPYREVLMKNRYVQRSFILNSQEKRNQAVSLKFSVVRSMVEGKNILLVDDSIVRGTTSRKIVQLLKAHGAKKVYLASTCPKILHPCFYGLDFPSKEELIANTFDDTNDKLATALGVDAVIYSDLEDLTQALQLKDFCHACLTGDYPYDQPAVVSRLS